MASFLAALYHYSNTIKHDHACLAIARVHNNALAIGE